MPIQVPNSNGTFSDLKEIYVGRDSISKVYSGSDLVWAKDITTISLPSSSNYNTDLRTNWLAYIRWRNQTGDCYFQINGWEINRFQCYSKTVGNFGSSGNNSVSSSSKFEYDYWASRSFKYGGKYYTLIDDSSVTNGYFPLTFTFQTYSLGRPGNNNLNNFFFITTANTTSTGRLDTSSHTSSDVLRVRDDIKKSHVYLIPNDNLQRNITIGAKDKTGTYNQGKYYGNSPQLFDNDVTPMFAQFSGRDINSKSGRVIPIANDSGLDTKRGHRDNTKDYWEDFSTNSTVFDQVSFNCQISVTMMAKVSDWTDKDISFVQVYSTGAESGNTHLTLFDFDDIRSPYMQKINFCLLTESQYVDKVAGGSYYKTTSVNYPNYPQTAYDTTQDASVYNRWEAETPQPPVVVPPVVVPPVVVPPVVVPPEETSDLVGSTLAVVRNVAEGIRGRHNLTIEFKTDGYIDIHSTGDPGTTIYVGSSGVGTKILTGTDQISVEDRYSWHDNSGTTAIGNNYSVKGTVTSGTGISLADGEWKYLSQDREYTLKGNQVNSTVNFEIKNNTTNQTVVSFTSAMEVFVESEAGGGGGS